MPVGQLLHQRDPRLCKLQQKRGQHHHALIKETVDLWRRVCDGNQETASWFLTEIEAMVKQFIMSEDNEILFRMQSTIIEYNDNQRPGGMDPDPEIVTALAAQQYLRRKAKYTVKRWCDGQPQDTMCSMATISSSCWTTSTPTYLMDTMTLYSSGALRYGTEQC
jgi:hypothetical protein